MTIWHELGIEPTADGEAIRRAYALRLKQVHPEDDAEGFQRLRTAYEAALASAQTLDCRRAVPGLAGCGIQEDGRRDRRPRCGVDQILDDSDSPRDVDRVDHQRPGRVVVAGQKIVRKTSRQTLGSVTLSIGVAEYRTGESEDDFIARSDAALYAAKHAGRNCVQVEADDEVENTVAANVA